MRIISDMHHQFLFESLGILFEDRLGWDLFRPIGTDWYTEGYWAIFDAMATAEQFLGLRIGEALAAHHAANPDGDDPFKNAGAAEIGAGLYEIPCLEFAPRRQKAITLAAAKDTKWDFILSSTPQHFDCYERFRKSFCPSAKHIFQVGNPWQAPQGARNILNSTTVPMPSEINTVSYHQEFSLERFHPEPKGRRDTVASLLHYGDLARFYEVEPMLMEDFTFLAHGAGNRDRSVPESIFERYLREEIGFLWHSKRDDGYGFNLHTAAACGKPIITCATALAHQRAGPLLVTGETCLNLDTMTNNDIAANLIRWKRDYEFHSEAVVKRFHEIVDFDAEFLEIQKFLERCT